MNSAPVQNGKRWLSVEACPVCSEADKACSKELNIEEYRHGDEIISLPEQGIRLVGCQRCRLFYKDVLPSPWFLSAVFARQAGKLWTDRYDFADEIEVIQALVGDEAFDVLDVGASSGGLLKALNDTEGRRSALDLVMYPGLHRWIRGEFIHGLADSQNLSWSNEPYDVVTMFDVAEHLYDPDQAFDNLRCLAKRGGFVILETGDTDSAWPQRFGVNNWWYACRFEHHVLWSKESIENVAARHGFRVVSFQRKRHKQRSLMPLLRDTADVTGIGLYRLVPAAYGWLAKMVGKTRYQPWSPFTRDHFRVVLQRG
jgi:hypothetical protein